jgi:hypothetical protein
MIREAAGFPLPALSEGSRTRAPESAVLERLAGGPGGGGEAAARTRAAHWEGRRTGGPSAGNRAGGRQGAFSETMPVVQQGHAEGIARSQLPPSNAECVVAEDLEDRLEATKGALNADTVGVEMGRVHGGGAGHPTLSDDCRWAICIKSYSRSRTEALLCPTCLRDRQCEMGTREKQRGKAIPSFPARFQPLSLVRRPLVSDVFRVPNPPTSLDSPLKKYIRGLKSIPPLKKSIRPPE